MSTKTEERVLKTNMISPTGTFQWVFLDKPKVDKNNPEKEPFYSITLLMDKKDPKVIEKLDQMKSCIKDALEKRFGDKVPAKYYTPIKDGDVETDKEGNPLTGVDFIISKPFLLADLREAMARVLPGS